MVRLKLIPKRKNSFICNLDGIGGNGIMSGIGNITILTVFASRFMKLWIACILRGIGRRV
jgi:hypothetical protein